MKNRRKNSIEIKKRISIWMAILCAAGTVAVPAAAEGPTEMLPAETLEESAALEMDEAPEEVEALEQSVEAAEEAIPSEESYSEAEVGPPMVVSGQAVEMIPVDEAHFPDANFRKLLQEEYGNKINPVEMKYLGVWGPEISDLSGIEYFPYLLELDCSETSLTCLDLSGNPFLEELYCEENKLTSLNLSNNRYLKELWCESNELTSLDLSGNPYLEYVYCDYNQITSLNLTGLSNLDTLECYDNPLQELDVSQNPLLYNLSCSECRLTELDLSNNPMLWSLDCYDNQLSNLDVSLNKRLKYLDCSGNQLASLDVTKNAMLMDLDCSKNQLTDLILTENPELERLICSNNQLTGLDLSENLDLWLLYCEKNQIRRLDMSMLKKVERFECDDEVTITKASVPIGMRLRETKISVGTETKFRFGSMDAYLGKKTYTVGNPNVASVSSKGVVTALKVGTTKITVKAAGTRNYKAASKTFTLKVVPGEVERFAAKNLAAGIKLAWTKVPGAKGYLLYRKTGSVSYSLIKKITDPNRLSYVDKSGLKNGKKYTYKILPYADTGAGRLPKTKTITRQG